MSSYWQVKILEKDRDIQNNQEEHETVPTPRKSIDGVVMVITNIEHLLARYDTVRRSHLLVMCQQRTIISRCKAVEPWIVWNLNITITEAELNNITVTGRSVRKSQSIHLPRDSEWKIGEDINRSAMPNPVN
ncbi:13203_t:CDS:2, partial [Acaulospora morrowiae]